MRNERELEENVAATDWKLNEEIRTAINEIFEEVGAPTYQNAAQAI